MGLLNIYPLVKVPSPLWDLNIVLTQFIKSPFGPLNEYSLFYLSINIVFIITIIKQQALMADPPFMVFQKDKIVLCPHPKFLFKVVTDFHLNQLIC